MEATPAPSPLAPIVNEDTTLGYLPMHGVMVHLMDAPAMKPISPIEDVLESNEFVSWGDGNEFPNYVEGRAFTNDLIPSVLNFKANQMASADLHYGIITGFDKNRRPIIERIIHKDIDDVWTVNNKRLFLEDGYRNLYWWHHAFVDFYLNDSKSRIVALSVQDSAHCRYSRQNEKTGNKDFIYIDANWPLNNSKTWKKIRCIDPYFDWVGQMKSLPAKQFIYPLFFNSPKRSYYQRTPWHSIIDSKWLDLADKIPKFKTALMDNQMVIKYVVHVPEDYWKWRYKDWDKMSQAERDTSRQAALTEFNDVLTGVTKVGKTIMLTFKTDAYNKQYGKWEVQEMKGNLGEGAYIEDSQEAADHILFSLAFDGTLIGKVPGKGMGAGSGSDKRLADDIFFKNNRPYAQKLAEALEVMCQYNGFKGPNGEKIVWFQEEQILTTLNNVTPENRP